MALTKVVERTETEGRTFRFASPMNGMPTGEQVITFPDELGAAWAGGTWKLEMQTPDGSWTAQAEVEWSDYGSLAFLCVFGERYRLSGSSAGVTAYASGVLAR